MLRRLKGNAAPDLEGLGRFALKRDRGKPLLFAGRGDEIRRIEALAGFAREGAQGQTHVISAALVSDSDGWPQHLTNALRGAADALIAGGGGLPQSSLDQARANGRRFRQEYYSDQMAPFQAFPELLAEVFGAMAGSLGEAGAHGATRYALRKAISRAYAAAPGLAEEMERPKALAKLLHQGLIQDFGGDRYDCPIPSMRRYVEDFCAQRGHPVAPAQAEQP